MRSAIVTAVGLIALGGAVHASACCAEITGGEVYLVGCVQSISAEPNRTVATIRVLEDGPDFTEGDIVRVDGGGGQFLGCGYSTSIDVSWHSGYVYEVWADRSGDIYNTNVCTGTSMLEDEEGEELACDRHAGCNMASAGILPHHLVVLLLAALLAVRTCSPNRLIRQPARLPFHSRK